MSRNDQNNVSTLIWGVGLMIGGAVALGLALTQDWTTFNAISVGIAAIAAMGFGIYMTFKSMTQ